ncbi:LysE family translocator [Methanopyrus kandleri]
MSGTLDTLTVGIALGVSGGLAPGPLQALIVAETLGNGLRAGLAVAVVPVITDGPLVTAAGLAAARLPGWVLRYLGLAGSAVLAYMGLSLIREKDSVESARSEGAGSSLRRAILVNLLNPHPYVFWLTVGSSMMGSARSLPEMVAFPVGFFLGIVSTQAGIAVVVHRALSLTPAERVGGTRRLSGVLLLGAAAYLAYVSLREIAGG